MPKGTPGNVRKVTLDSGQTLTLSISTSDLFALSPADRDFVFSVVDLITGYASRKKTAALSSVKPAAEPTAE